MTTESAHNDSTLCQCPDPLPGGGEHGDECLACGCLIGQAIIGGEVHEGYTSLGNGQAFFDAKETWHLDAVRWNVAPDGYFRTLADAEVVVPHHSRKARLLGTEFVSFDHVVHPDGSVDVVIQNRTLEHLPDGPTFP